MTFNRLLSGTAGIFLFPLLVSHSLPVCGQADPVRAGAALQTPFVDAPMDYAVRIPMSGEATRPLDLPWPFPAAGRSFDQLVVGRDGWIELHESAEAFIPAASGRDLKGLAAGGSRTAAGPRLQVFGSPLVADPAQSHILFATWDNGAVIRWVRFTPEAFGHPVTFEAHLLRDGSFRYQYLLMPPSGLWHSAFIGHEGLAATTRVAPGQNGFTASNGAAVVFEPVAGRNPAAPPPPQPPTCDANGDWCAAAGCTFYQGTTNCNTTVSQNWSFNEGGYCEGCTYKFYVLVECGTEMHIPLDDMEGATIKITEMITGATQTITSFNQRYLDPAFVFPGVSCGAGPPSNRTRYTGPSYFQQSTSNSWGGGGSGNNNCKNIASYDQNNDGAIACCSEIPCDPGNTVQLNISAGELQIIDNKIVGAPGLCGVYRVEVTSGGFEWDLFANCDGSNAGQFDIYAACSDALAAFTPYPDLTISDITVAASPTCPDRQVSFRVNNVGCAAISNVPVRIVSSCGDVFDMTIAGPIAGNSYHQVTNFPIAVSCYPADVTIYADPDDVIAECSETPGAAACAIIPGDQSATLSQICTCTAAGMSAAAGNDASICPGGTATLAGTAAGSCPAGGSYQYRWEDSLGNVIQDWSADPTVDVSPACPAGGTYTLRTRCTTDLLCMASDTKIVSCTPPPAPAVTPDPVTTCPATGVTLDAGAGYSSYSWAHGPVTQTVAVNPATTTTYSVTVSNGTCTGSDSVTVDVVPPPTFTGAFMATDSSCGVRVSWPAAIFASGGGHYDIYRTAYTGTETCATALALAPVATNVTALTFDDLSTVLGASYLYAVRAEDNAAAPGACAAGIHGGMFADSACLGPVTDASEGTDLIPLDMNDQLRVQKSGTAPVLDWSTLTPGATTSHYHVYRQTDPSQAFGNWTLVAGDAPLLAAVTWTDPGTLDTPGLCYFYDARSADSCENISPPILSVSAAATSPSCDGSGAVDFTATIWNGVPAYTYDWNFGDGSPHAFTSSASHTYAYPPYTYTATLTVEDSTDTGGPDGQIAVVSLSVGVGPGGVGVAAGSDAPQAAGVPVNFTAAPSGGTGTYTYSWTFGDNASSSSQNPSHAYGAPGTYPVTVTVRDEAGCTAVSSFSVTIF